MTNGAESTHSVRRDDVRLSFSAVDGALVGLGWADSSAEWAGHGGRTATVDARLKGRGWGSGFSGSAAHPNANRPTPSTIKSNASLLILLLST